MDMVDEGRIRSCMWETDTQSFGMIPHLMAILKSKNRAFFFFHPFFKVLKILHATGRKQISAKNEYERIYWNIRECA